MYKIIYTSSIGSREAVQCVLAARLVSMQNVNKLRVRALNWMTTILIRRLWCSCGGRLKWAFALGPGLNINNCLLRGNRREDAPNARMQRIITQLRTIIIIY